MAGYGIARARLRNRPIQIYVVVVSLYTLIQLLIQGPNIPNIGKVCPVYYLPSLTLARFQFSWFY